MTSLKFATAVHVVLLLAHKGADAPGAAVASSYLAASIGANPVVVRRVLASLAAAKLVATRAGAHGGAWLVKKPAKIRMSAVYEAVEELPCPGFRPKGSASCPVGRAAPGVICEVIGAMRKASESALAKLSLADLLKKLEAAAR